MSTRTLENYINGEFTNGSGDFIPVLNPATGETIAQAPETSLDDVNRAVDAAEAAQVDWAKLPAAERASYLYKIADKIRKNAKDLARQITEEQGKILELADGEVAFTLLGLEYTAEWARRIEGEILESDRPNENVFMFRMPIGVIAGILPWNFPFFLIVRKLAPSLVAGNTIVIKPSEETPINADDFMRIADDVGLPPGVVNFVHGRGATVGNALAGHPKVGMVSFTGSVETGSKVMHAAADNITKVNLELGGKAPAIVLADADIDLAANMIKQSRVINSGQVCNCAERVYVVKKIAEQFTEKLSTVMAASKYGNPLEEEDLDYGPQINDKGIEKVETLVSSAVSAGATVVTGGKRSDRTPGNYYEPTVLADVKQDMDIIQREIFGPVAPVVTVDNLDEAISLANQSDYGLTSSIYTKDINVAMRACKEIRFGETYINRENMEALNCFHAGVRKSGIGGADGKHGFYEYMQTHMVYIQYDA